MIVPEIDGWTTTTTPSVQVVIESLIAYAQREYEAKHIGWDSYAVYTTDLYDALCGIDRTTPTENT